MAIEFSKHNETKRKVRPPVKVIARICLESIDGWASVNNRKAVV